MANPNVQSNLPSLEQDFMRLTIKLNEDIDPAHLQPLISSIEAIRRMFKKLTPDELHGIFADTRPDLELKMESLIEESLPDNIRKEIMGRVTLFLMELKKQQEGSENVTLVSEIHTVTHEETGAVEQSSSPVNPKPESPAAAKTAPVTKSTIPPLPAKTPSPKAKATKSKAPEPAPESPERPKTLDERYEIAMYDLKETLRLDSDFASLNQDAKEALRYGSFALVASSLNTGTSLSKADVETLMNSLEHRKAAAKALETVFKINATGARGFIARVDGSLVKGRAVLRRSDWLEKLGELGKVFIDEGHGSIGEIVGRE